MLDTDCTDDESLPKCGVTKQCVASCEADTDCTDGVCKDGGCVECKVDVDCTGNVNGTKCDTEKYECLECL